MLYCKLCYCTVQFTDVLIKFLLHKRHAEDSTGDIINLELYDSDLQLHDCRSTCKTANNVEL